MKIKYFIEQNRMTAPKELRGREIIIHIRKEGEGKFMATITVPKLTLPKRTNKPVEHFVKNCPECGGDMIKSHPKKSKWNVIIAYRRITCQSCGYYEAYHQPHANINSEWSLDEKEQFENKKANKYYSPIHSHRKQILK